MSKTAKIGTTVRLFPTMKDQQAIVVRVQAHLSVQFTYSRLDNDDVLGIERFDGDWEDDFTEEKKNEKPWLHSGRRKQRAGRRYHEKRNTDNADLNQLHVDRR